MRKTAIIFLSFFSLFIAPGYLSIVLHSSSLRDGILIGIFLFLLISLLTYKIRRIEILQRKNVHLACFVLLIIMIHFALSLINKYSVDYHRFLLSYILLLFFFLSSMLFVNFIKLLQERDRASTFDYSLKLFFPLLLAIGAVTAFVFDQGFARRGHMFFFREPSHYSLTLLPFLAYFINKSNHKLMFLSISIVLAYFLKSATLFAGIGLIILLLMQKNFKYLLLPLSAGLVVLFIYYYSVIDLSYFLERISISSDSNNISTLVYLSGWESALSALVDTQGMGVGLQQLGVIVFRSASRMKLERYGVGDWCAWDGSFLASKIICEFGILGVLAILIYVGFAFTVTRNLYRAKARSDEDVFFAVAFITFSVALFVRGNGYFSPTTFMFFSSLFWLNFGVNPLFARDRRAVVTLQASDPVSLSLSDMVNGSGNPRRRTKGLSDIAENECNPLLTA